MLVNESGIYDHKAIYKFTGEEVEILKRGHWADTVFIKLRSGHEIQVYLRELEEIGKA